MPWNIVSFSVMKFLLPLKIYTKNMHIPHILERYRWIFLKLCQIIVLLLGLIPMIFLSLVDFVYPIYYCQQHCVAGNVVKPLLQYIENT